MVEKKTKIRALRRALVQFKAAVDRALDDLKSVPALPEGRSNVQRMTKLLESGADDEAILAAFTRHYAAQGKTNALWVAWRVMLFKKAALRGMSPRARRVVQRRAS